MSRHNTPFSVPLSEERKHVLDGLLMGLSDEDMIYLTQAFQRRQYEAARRGGNTRPSASPAIATPEPSSNGRHETPSTNSSFNGFDTAAQSLAAAYPNSVSKKGRSESNDRRNVSFGTPPSIPKPANSFARDDDSDATVEHEEELSTQLPKTLDWSNDSFFVLFGMREIAVIENGTVRKIGKVADDVTSLARRRTDGTIFCCIRTSIYTVQRTNGKMMEFGRMLHEGRPCKFVRALTFSPDGQRLFCVAKAGSFRSVHGDAICEVLLDQRCALRILVATDLQDIVALEAVDKESDPNKAEFYAWSSFKGLIAIDPGAFVNGLSPPSAVRNVSIRALTRSPRSGALIGAGAKIYTVRSC